MQLSDGKMSFKKMVKFILSKHSFSSVYFNMIKDYVKNEYLVLEDAKLPLVWNSMVEYVDQYNEIPNYQQLANVMFYSDKTVKSETISGSLNEIKVVDIDVITNNDDFAKHITEEFIKDKATEHVLTSSAKVFVDMENSDGMDKKIRQMTEWFEEISLISLNPDLGDDYYRSASKRYDELFVVGEKSPFALHYLNNATLGGTEKGRLSVYFLSSGVGKTMLMANDVAHLLRETDLNVVYISLEDGSVAMRVDQNMLDMTKEKLMGVEKEAFIDMIDDINEKYKVEDRFVFKKYPSRSVTVNQLKSFIKELELKKDFKADVVFIDYLNLIKDTKGNSLYEIYSFISADLKGFAQEMDVDLRTATQTNRSGFANKTASMVTDIFLSEMSDSIAVVFNSDLIIGGFVNPILSESNQMVVKLLKNRIYDVKDIKCFVDVDVKKQKVWDKNVPIDELSTISGSASDKMMDESFPDYAGKDWSVINNAIKF